MDKEREKLKLLNQFMKERLIWFAENSFNADEAYRVHQQAIKDLEEYEKEIERDQKDREKWAKWEKELSEE